MRDRACIDDLRRISALERRRLSKFKSPTLSGSGASATGILMFHQKKRCAMAHKVSITFDNGPYQGVTEQVLDELKAAGVAATFFTVGRLLQDRRSLKIAERALAEGHRIGNHTWSHERAIGTIDDDERTTAEILGPQRFLDRLGVVERLFRPVGGRGSHGGALGPHLLNQKAVNILQQNNYSVVLWNAVPRDWERPEDWVDVALTQCLELSHAVLVLHDIPTGAMKKLGRFLELANRNGIEFSQTFPDHCLVMKVGHALPELRSYLQ
jgi:peptidoglycan-N-acetylglucosamine deacetylase